VNRQNNHKKIINKIGVGGSLFVIIPNPEIARISNTYEYCGQRNGLFLCPKIIILLIRGRDTVAVLLFTLECQAILFFSI